MIRVDKIEVTGWKAAIRGMRNPMNSWKRSNSHFITQQFCDDTQTLKLSRICGGIAPVIGNDVP